VLLKKKHKKRGGFNQEAKQQLTIKRTASEVPVEETEVVAKKKKNKNKKRTLPGDEKTIA
jgi:hypothetical protein